MDSRRGIRFSLVARPSMAACGRKAKNHSSTVSLIHCLSYLDRSRTKSVSVLVTSTTRMSIDFSFLPPVVRSTVFFGSQRCIVRVDRRHDEHVCVCVQMYASFSTKVTADVERDSVLLLQPASVERLLRAIKRSASYLEFHLILCPHASEPFVERWENRFVQKYIRASTLIVSTCANIDG